MLTAVLPVSEVPQAAILLQTGTEMTTFDTAEDADSESQEGETDPPATKIPVGILLNAPLLSMVEKKAMHAYVFLVSRSEG